MLEGSFMHVLQSLVSACFKGTRKSHPTSCVKQVSVSVCSTCIRHCAHSHCGSSGYCLFFLTGTCVFSQERNLMDHDCWDHESSQGFTPLSAAIALRQFWMQTFVPGCSCVGAFA